MSDNELHKLNGINELVHDAILGYTHWQGVDVDQCKKCMRNFIGTFNLPSYQSTRDLLASHTRSTPEFTLGGQERIARSHHELFLLLCELLLEMDDDDFKKSVIITKHSSILSDMDREQHYSRQELAPPPPPPPPPPLPKPPPPKPEVWISLDDVGQRISKLGFKTTKTTLAHVKQATRNVANDPVALLLVSLLREQAEANELNQRLLRSIDKAIKGLPGKMARAEKTEEKALERAKQKTARAQEKANEALPAPVTVVQMTPDEIADAVDNQRALRRF